LQVAREEKISRVTGYVLPENVEMARICEKLGFKLHHTIDDPTLQVVYEL
jgi:acetyltransferase